MPATVSASRYRQRPGTGLGAGVGPAGRAFGLVRTGAVRLGAVVLGAAVVAPAFVPPAVESFRHPVRTRTPTAAAAANPRHRTSEGYEMGRFAPPVRADPERATGWAAVSLTRRR
jgi:hypothetical protein